MIDRFKVKGGTGASLSDSLFGSTPFYGISHDAKAFSAVLLRARIRGQISAGKRG
jgi:hypothetical protein